MLSGALALRRLVVEQPARAVHQMDAAAGRAFERLVLQRLRRIGLIRDEMLDERFGDRTSEEDWLHCRNLVRAGHGRHSGKPLNDFDREVPSATRVRTSDRSPNVASHAHAAFAAARLIHFKALGMRNP